MTGQEILMFDGQKSKDQEQRIFGITCTEWGMDYVQATSPKFQSQDLGKSEIYWYTMHIYWPVHNVLNT